MKKNSLIFKSKNSSFSTIIICIFWVWVFGRYFLSINLFLGFFLIILLLTPVIIVIIKLKVTYFTKNGIIIKKYFTLSLVYKIQYNEISKIEIKYFSDTLIHGKNLKIFNKSGQVIYTSIGYITLEDFYNKVLLNNNVKLFVEKNEKFEIYIPPTYPSTPTKNIK